MLPYLILEKEDITVFAARANDYACRRVPSRFDARHYLFSQHIY